jgi:leucyl-tRNA synthetase/predicted alpha/beta hydrolase family esterase
MSEIQKYNHQSIEKKWQEQWEKQKLYATKDDPNKKKFYCLIEFPYPSADGLHVGHPRSYTALDIVVRKRRMEGDNALFPIGFDAFGLPAENYAIKVKKNPADITKQNIERFRSQLKALGLSFDWSREVVTTDPEYYKWTQWIFLQLFKAGLLYQKEMPINWCPSCKTGLANEEVVSGKCERCGTVVTKKNLKQWIFKITDYADRLIDDLDTVDYLDKIKTQQINWIGKSDGARVQFRLKDLKYRIDVFTTRPDTLFGATYMVLAPEHELVEKLLKEISNSKEVEKYIRAAQSKSDLERTDLAKEKTGVELKGIKVINPASNDEMSVWVADYVLTGYGTGAIMAVPAHDERDWEFAKKFNLPIKEVISGGDVKKKAYSGNGKVVDSEEFDGLDSEKGIKKITAWIEKESFGKAEVNYKLRDWIFSRQHYWGEPIPLIHCENCKEKEKKTVLIIHGTGSYCRFGWYGWLADELEKLGHKVITPDMPNPNEPDLAEWLSELDKYKDKLNENSVVIGHSLGGPVAMHFVSKLSKKVGKIILVAPTSDKIDWKEYAKLHPEDPVDHQIEFHRTEISYDNVHKNVGRVIYYYSDNDFYIPKSIPEHYKKVLKADFRMLKGRNHFSVANGLAFTFPEIFEEIIEGNQMPVGIVSVPEKDLPVELPKVKNYEPTDTGESPLAGIKKWVSVKCPECGGKAKRETDTMPNWAGSSWYFLRYCDPHNKKEFASKKSLENWMPVDLYNGGMEHTTLHLLYSRFWHKALYDLKLVPQSEPYQKRISHGMVLAEDGKKMSKSLGNVVNPDDVIKEYGADTMRMYEMFMGPFAEAIPWDTKGIVGVRRFLDKVNSLSDKVKKNIKSDEHLIHKTIKKVTEDINEFRFNTAVSALMIMVNEMHNQKEVGQEVYDKFLVLLSPFAPHLTEEIWEKFGNKASIHLQPWPEYDPELAKENEIEFVIQINGKVKDKCVMPADVSEEDVLQYIEKSERIQKLISDKQIVKKIFVPGKLLNIVVK